MTDNNPSTMENATTAAQTATAAADGTETPESAPQGTFEKLPFEQLMASYNHLQKVPPALELTQAFLMTNNMKETAGSLPNAGYFYQNDFVGDTMRLSDAMTKIGKLMGNLGPADKSSNFILEQRSLMKAQAQEGREIRDLLDQMVVDGLEYVRIKEKIAETRQRVKPLLEDESEALDSHDEVSQQRATPETEENSDDALARQKETEIRIRKIIRQMRRDAKDFLGLQDFKSMPLSKIYHKLQRNREYRRRRETKALQKEVAVKDQLRMELAQLDSKIAKAQGQENAATDSATKMGLEKKIQQLQQIVGLEKRVKLTVPEPISLTELDSKALNANSFQLQNLLYDFCQIKNRAQKKSDQRKNGGDKLFGKIKKLPSKSTLFSGFPKELSSQQQEGNLSQQVKMSQNQKGASNYELVKVIGLEPEKLFETLPKYRVQVQKMPRFSNVFDSYESFVPGLGGHHATSSAMPGIAGQNIPGGPGSYARQDGRSVISLNFNPYELDSKQKTKIYEGAMKELNESRALTAKKLTDEAREKQEQVALKRAWTNIAKKDIPKAFRAYQKYKQDQESNTKRLAMNCLKEVRKRAVKSQRLAKENTNRAKKLTKEMMSFWKKRDRELADIKRRKDKFEKDLKKRQQEEEENLLQKKRLEYLMKQSEIYAHFMANKMGMQSETKAAHEDTLAEEKRLGYQRAEVDEANARVRMARMINEDKRRLKEFDGDSDESMVQEEELVNVNSFEGEGGLKPIECPKIINATLKHYQLKGLRWLDNLYEQGINGILADEMGLGKTIQAISMMSHIAESKGTWGPFLVIVPVTTLFNWQNELARFCPSLKVLPYFGTLDERKKLAKFLDPKYMLDPRMKIHVVITSYNLIVNNPQDQARLMKIKWNYMILDEAQAIKNNASRRWKVLLGFNTRNRLLLTGTPIQNSMAELWALLHFIMPKLFDNHEQFQDWFSKDIEASSMDKGELNKHQLKRLHAILKPFMLRRLKCDVEQEIAPKKEVNIYCDMTFRQKLLYKGIRDKISTADLFELSENKQKMEGLMNLIMQFRKVCNHPDLFERREGKSPLQWKELAIGVVPNPHYLTSPYIGSSMANPIVYNVPKLVFDECFLVSDNMNRTHMKLQKGLDIALSSFGIDVHMDLFNIFGADNLYKESLKSGSGFGILRVLAASNGWSVSELCHLIQSDPVYAAVSMNHYHQQKHKKMIHQQFQKAATIDSVEINFHSSRPLKDDLANIIDAQVIDFSKRDDLSVFYRELKIVSKVDNSVDIVQALVPEDCFNFFEAAGQLQRTQTKTDISIAYVHAVNSASITFECPHSGTFVRFANSIKYGHAAKRVLLGEHFKPARHQQLGRNPGEQQIVPFLHRKQPQRPSQGLVNEYLEKGILNCNPHPQHEFVELPQYGRLVTDCAKMRKFAELVTRLHATGHRCLVFCQMTRMLDILEDFMTWKKMQYFRLDGQTSNIDRRYLVEEFQRNNEIFAFLLSTRAGGLGINLIAADSVIFYDNDWNPTMDEQATDRAHRIGQTKEVTVYRIMTRGTVEEKIVKRAKQKQNVQSTVYGDTFKMKEVVQMVMDDEVAEKVQQASFIKGRRGGGGGKRPVPKVDQPAADTTPKKPTMRTKTPTKSAAQIALDRQANAELDVLMEDVQADIEKSQPAEESDEDGSSRANKLLAMMRDEGGDDEEEEDKEVGFVMNIDDEDKKKDEEQQRLYPEDEEMVDDY